MLTKGMCFVEFKTLGIRLQLYICFTRYNSATQVLLQFPSSGMVFTPPQVKFPYFIIFLNIIKKKNERKKEEIAKCQEDPQSKQQFSSNGKKTAFCCLKL